MPCARGDNNPVYLDSRDKRTRIGRLMTRMIRTIGSAEKLIAPSRSVIPMATLTWRCEAKPRFLQTHLADKQRCTQKHLGGSRGTPECRVETLKALVQRPQCRPPMPGWRAADDPTGCAPQPEHTKTIISPAHRKSPRGFNSTESHRRGYPCPGEPGRGRPKGARATAVRCC